MPIDQYTVVEHSAHGYRGDPGSAHALETRHLTKRAEITQVRKAGGILFDSYLEADEWAAGEMYPPGIISDQGDEFAHGLLPCAPGEFSEERIDGLRIYIVGADKAAIADLKAMRDELAR